jgi:myo-inositol-1(or 4)-monophosphatase
MQNNKIKKVALNAAHVAGKYLMHEFQSFDRSNIKLKSFTQIVTAADLGSEKIIINHIKNNFPQHHILSEEAGEKKSDSDYFWIIDPIDGTTNFTMHNPLWSISIGLAYQGELILGVVYAPMLKELYIAEKGKGAKLNGKKIKVSQISEGKILNAYCHGSDKKDVKRAIKYYSYQKLQQLDCRQLGSAAIELAFVATGRIESIVIPGLNSWDVAAGILIVREAGGKVTDFKNNEWNLKSKDMLASNRIIHNQIIKALKTTKI